MTRRAAHRSRPVVFVAVVALSAVAFLGQAIGTPAAATAGATSVAAVRALDLAIRH